MCTILNFTLDFISSFQKHCIILFLQFSDVTKGLVQYHVLTLKIKSYFFFLLKYFALNRHNFTIFRQTETPIVSYLFKCLGTWQKITNAVNPGINLFFSVSFN